MPDSKRQATVFDPNSPTLRRKLWARLDTPDGPRLFIIWPRLFKLLAVLLVFGWLAGATALWAFVKFQRGITEVRFVDIAFFPLRRAEYRATLGRHHFARAQEQLQQQRWNEAILSLRVSLANAPDNLEARRLLADFYLGINKPRFALQVLEAGATHAREDTRYLRQLFNLLRVQREQERALQLAATLLPATPDASLPHRIVAWQAAMVNLDLKRYDEAEALVQRWQLDRSPEGQSLLADIAVARGQPEAAIQRLETQLQRNPQNEANSVQLTRLYLRLGQLDAARRTAVLRSLAHGHSPGAHLDLLAIEWQSGLREDFERGVQNYLALYAGDPQALQLLSTLMADNALPDQARRIVTTAATAGHPLTPSLLGLMQAECGAGHYVAALATAAEVDRQEMIPPRANTALAGLKAWACFGRGDQAQGEGWLGRYLAQDNFSVADALRLGGALEKMGRLKEAERTLTAAADKTPLVESALLELARYHVRREAWPAAGALLPRLLQLPDPPTELVQTIQWHRDNPTAGNLLTP